MFILITVVLHWSVILLTPDIHLTPHHNILSDSQLILALAQRCEHFQMEVVTVFANWDIPNLAYNTTAGIQSSVHMNYTTMLSSNKNV